VNLYKQNIPHSLAIETTLAGGRVVSALGHSSTAEIQEKDFGRIQIDRIAEMQKWAENIKNVQEHMNLAIVAANNHYAGFGPGTVNIFRNMIGLPEAKWEEKEMGIQKQEEEYTTHESRQRTLSEFMS
jgi:hypothetical protein